MFFLLVFSIIILMVISYQDFKDRAVNWILFPVLIVLLSAFSIQINQLVAFLESTALNLLLLLGVFSFLSLYFIIKHKALKNIINNQLGLGDICFWLCATAFFSPVNFLLFFLLSLVCSLIFHLIVVSFQKEKSVPLAGYQSIVMATVLVISFYMPQGFFQKDDWLVDYLLLSQ